MYLGELVEYAPRRRAVRQPPAAADEGLRQWRVRLARSKRATRRRLHGGGGRDCGGRLRHHPAGGGAPAAQLGADPGQPSTRRGSRSRRPGGAGDAGRARRAAAADGVRRAGAQPRPAHGQRPADLGRRPEGAPRQRPLNVTVAGRSSPTSTRTCRVIAAGETLTWVYTTTRRLPARARPFAIVGAPAVGPARPRVGTAPVIARARAPPGSGARPLAVAVTLHNSSSVPQYQLQVYAFALSGRSLRGRRRADRPASRRRAPARRSGWRCSGSLAHAPTADRGAPRHRPISERCDSRRQPARAVDRSGSVARAHPIRSGPPVTGAVRDAHPIRVPRPRSRCSPATSAARRSTPTSATASCAAPIAATSTIPRPAI